MKKGPARPLRKEASSLNAWCPEALLELFRESESYTYFLNMADGLMTRDGKPIGLKDRYSKNNATS